MGKEWTCPECGSPVSPRTSVCSECGAELDLRRFSVVAIVVAAVISFALVTVLSVASMLFSLWPLAGLETEDLATAVGWSIAGLLIPLTMLAFGFRGIRKGATARSRGAWVGVLIGTSTYLLIFAGMCTSLYEWAF